MNNPSKVLWGEGLFLRPQHFQQQDRYHEARLNQTASALHPYAWGVRRIVIDHEALKNDILRVTELSLIFPDGEICRAPENDLLPQPVRLGSLDATPAALTFHAALPSLKDHGDNCADGGSEHGDARYGRHDSGTQDLYTRAADIQVSYLRKSLRLISGQESLESFDSFPLLRLRRTEAGGFEVDPGFAPPSVSIEAAPGLHLQLARLTDKLLAKVNALYGHHREPGKNRVEIRDGDMSSFWLLHTASAGYAALTHYLTHRELHPERLFADMLSLAGGLMAYSRQHQLEDLPAYAHGDPGPAFARLDTIIRNLLDTVISPRYAAIALRSDKPCWHRAEIEPGQVDSLATLYLAVRADLPLAALIALVPLQFKVAAPDDADHCVLAALPGVRLQHVPQVPAALPLRPDTCYFALEAKSVLYQNMLKAQAVAIHAPAGIRDLKLELIAIAA